MPSKFNPERYNLQAITAYYRKKPLLVWARSLAILLPLLWFILLLRWDRFTGNLQKKAPQRAVQVRQLLTKLGYAFIKIGQALSTRPDIIPPVYMEELAQLQDQLPPLTMPLLFNLSEKNWGMIPTPSMRKFPLSPLPPLPWDRCIRANCAQGKQ